MKGKKKRIGLIVVIVGILSVILVLGGYNFYRFPAAFSRLSDHSLDEAQVEELLEVLRTKPDKKSLVAYFSYSGTTRNVAQVISEQTRADLFEIATVKRYSDVYSESNREIRRKERPRLTDVVENMEEYDIVFVGFPVWWHATPAPVNTFLESYDLTDKLIIPFCTSGGSGVDEVMPTFLDSCQGLAVYGETRITTTAQIETWLTQSGLLEEATETGNTETGNTETATTETGNTKGGDATMETPEEIQSAGDTVELLENLPTYTYTQQEIEVYNDGQRIYGIAYIPDTGAEKVPLVISAHGLGGSYRSNLAYAEQLASHGLAAYCFDFRGGGGSNSDGDTTQMSVMTEVSDIEAVLEAAQGWEFADTDKIVLLGTSQGGITSAIAAARHADAVRGLILIYPAFLVSDAVHEKFNSLEEVPDVFPYEWITAGRPYVEDMWDYDVYEEIGNYQKKVLLMHGDADGIVPISYSDRAALVYEDVDYFVIDGAGHGFHGEAFDEAVRHIFDYLQETGIYAG